MPLPLPGGPAELQPIEMHGNGQAERMNRTIENAIVKVFHDEEPARLKAHVFAFVRAYTFAKRLKALRRKTPFHTICQA
jgi:hypothetical protein